MSSNTTVIEIIADQGKIIGYGEGLPVEFVTGETPDSTKKGIRLLVEKDFFPWDLNDISQIWNFVDSLPNGKGHNAAICAMEMALLDALGKSQNKYIIEYFPKDFYASTICYSAAITLGNKDRIIRLCELIKKTGITHLRIKLGDDFQKNRDAIETVGLIFGDNCDLRIDPNGVWDYPLALKHLPLIEKYNVKVVEEPMERDNPNFIEFAQKMRLMGVILMACESAPTLEDVERIVKEGHYQMINVKLSRSGGFRRALRIIEYLRSKGINFQIGCTLGESGVLSAGGRVLCLLCGDAIYYDGSYDRFLLEENVTLEHISFGLGGKAGPLEGPGLGIEVNPQRLKRLSADSSTISIMRP